MTFSSLSSRKTTPSHHLAISGYESSLCATSLLERPVMSAPVSMSALNRGSALAMYSSSVSTDHFSAAKSTLITLESVSTCSILPSEPFS